MYISGVTIKDYLYPAAVSSSYSVNTGGGNKVQVANNASICTFSGDFTIEAWVYVSSNGNGYTIFNYWDGNTSGSGARNSLSLTSGTNSLGFGGGQGGVNPTWTTVNSISVSLNTWYHVAFGRYGSTYYIYFNGTLYQTAPNATWAPTYTPLVIGAFYDGYTTGTGYISNFRIVNGTSVYTTAFTPPTSPLTAIANTTLLTCQNATLVDNSSNHFTISTGGSPTVSNTIYPSFISGGAVGTGGITVYEIPYVAPASVSVSFLVVGGGGGGSQGGGGGGGVVIGSTSVTLGAQIIITVGNGGVGVKNSPNGYNGSDSSIFYSPSINIVGLGGGGGGASNTTGNNGGSGGGGGGNSGGITSFGLALQPTQSQTTFNGTYTNYGHNGIGNQSSSSPYPTGGGGGAGGSPSSSNAPGGAGIVGPFSSTTYAVGGAGNNYFNAGAGANAGANTGNGGGGASAGNNTQAGNGGSGVVVLSSSYVAAVPSLSGSPTITKSNNNYIYTFNNSGLLTYTNNTFLNYAASFNGTNQYLSSTAGAAAINFGTGTYTIEFWIYNNARPASSAFIFGGTGQTYQLGLNSSGNIFISKAAVVDLTASTIAIPLTTWTHVAIVRTSTSTNGATYYINGISGGSVTDANNYTGTAILNIGTTNNSTSYIINGYLSNFRITNTAVYTGNFTPSTTHLTAISGTQLLTCQDAAFVDNSSNNYTIINNNTATTTYTTVPFNY